MSAKKIHRAARAFHAQRELRRRWLGDDASVRHSVVNDAVAIYFRDPATATGFVARWCAGAQVETVDGVFRLREDAPAPWVGLKPHGML